MNILFISPQAIALVGLLLACTPAFARLGETEQQLTNRYGAPLQVSDAGQVHVMLFRFGAYYVQTRSRANRSVSEYAALASKSAELTDTVALAVASMMAGVTNWTRLDAGPNEIIWTADGLRATLSRIPGHPQSVFVITTAELALRSKESEQTPPEKLAPGF